MAVRGRATLEVSIPNAVVAPVVIEVKTDANSFNQGAALPPTSVATAKPAAAAAIQRTLAGRLNAHESIYVIYGPDAPGAKFQFSMKYRLLSFGEETGNEVPRTLQFGYTQRSLWDIRAASSPFYDTSYMPELFYESLAPMPPNRESCFNWIGYQAGYKHESNGRDGSNSRSMNTVYLRSVFSIGALDRWHLLVIPEVFTYIASLGDNADLKGYRGYGQLRLVLGRNTGPSLIFTGRTGNKLDHLTTQLDLTVPMRTRVLDFGVYFLIQYFNGFGESMLSYRAKSTTVRAGICVVR